MMQTVAALIPAAVDYERTLVLAIEVSNKSWVLAAQVPGLPYTKAKRTINPDAGSLMAAIAGYRARATATGHSVERVITVYEAGWSGRRSEGTSPLFGMALRRRLHRWCRSLGALPSRIRDSGWDQRPPDVRFAGEACSDESPALDRSLPKSALDGETIM
jgi:hypothetical protein